MRSTQRLAPLLLVALAIATANASQPMADSTPPLHAAVASGGFDAVERLLVHGATVEAVDERGWTALHVAATRNEPATVALLLAAGADVGATDDAGETPLHVAARRFQLDTIRILLAHGADPSARNSLGQTPLHVLGAAQRIQDDAFLKRLDAIAAELIAAGADADTIADGYPALQPPQPTETRQIRDTWTDYDDIGPTLLAYETTYPTLAKRVHIGTSVQGRDLWAIRISDNVLVEEDEPEFKYIATMHGDEIVGTKMCMLLIDELLTNYGDPNYPLINTLVDDVEIWILPLMNPDGYDRAYRSRYNANGIDLNRHFPDGAPPSPDENTTDGMEPEIAAIMNWTAAHSFVCSANFHGGALVANYPFDNPGSASRYTPDQDLFVYISEEYTRHNSPMWNSPSFYHGISNGADWYIIDGGMQDWNYRYMGCNEVTMEIGETKEPPASQIGTYWNDNRDSMIAYMATCRIGVRGVVTDAHTGTPLAATVRVIGRDHDVYTDPDVGDYHRMLLPGSYNLLISAEGYESATLPVSVPSGAAARYDVALTPGPYNVTVTAPNGSEMLTVDTPTTITWFAHPDAQYHVQHSSNYGESELATDDFESGTLGDDYTTGGSADWYVTSDTAHNGTWSARAGVIGNNRNTWLERVVDGETSLTFWYRVSSENNYDYFDFMINGASEIHVAGEVGWTQYSTWLGPGPHTLRWVYDKDYSQSDGSDTVWIDDVELYNDLTTWDDVVTLTAAGANNVAWTPTVASDTCKVRVRAYHDGAYGEWDESDALFSVQTPSLIPGDLDCSGSIDYFDINPFLIALQGQAAYDAAFPDCEWLNGDCDEDGDVDYYDINPFIDRLGS